MRSAEGDSDLTARARIRDTAIRCVARDGVNVSLRAIAAECGVSASLIVHHFGSRAGLREYCDEYVLSSVRELKSSVLEPGSGVAAMLAQIEDIGSYAPLIGYLIRSLQARGPASQAFLDHLAATTEGYLEQGVASGVVRASRDPRARARALVEFSTGALLLHVPGPSEPLDLDGLPTWLRSYTDRLLLPLLELYTEPLLTDSAMLDAYLAVREAAAP
jgi:AcrR family transcriptional regulator